MAGSIPSPQAGPRGRRPWNKGRNGAEEAAAGSPITLAPWDAMRHEKMRAFLAAYARTGVVVIAEQQSGIARTNHYRWLERSPRYGRLFAEAQKQALQVLEAEVFRRGVLGVEEPVYQGGRLVGHIRRYSDNLLMFRVKKLDPSYRERTELTGPGGGPILSETRIILETAIPRPARPGIPALPKIAEGGGNVIELPRKEEQNP